MSGLGNWLLGALILMGVTVVLDLVSEEFRGWLARLPRLVVRLAAQLQRPEDRQEFREEWTANVAAVASGTEGIPITRFIWSMVEASRGISASVRIWVEIGWPSRIGRRRRSATFTASTATAHVTATAADLTGRATMTATGRVDALQVWTAKRLAGQWNRTDWSEARWTAIRGQWADRGVDLTVLMDGKPCLVQLKRGGESGEPCPRPGSR